MSDEKIKTVGISNRIVVALGLSWLCFMAVSVAEAQVADATHKIVSTGRLLTAKQGRSIVAAAWEQSADETQDCSHVVHQIYLDAGFDYPYGSSLEMYAGHKSFSRVEFPRAGDLIVWPGHMGIVVDPVKHSFYSLVRTGLEEQDYKSPYWRSRGRSHFYRYRVQNPDVLTTTAAKTPAPAKNLTTVREAPSAEETFASYGPLQPAPEHTGIYGPLAPLELAIRAQAFEIPSSTILVTGSEPPTREQVAEGISALIDVAGNVLRSDDPLRAPLPVRIVEKFSVERVEILRDHGWAQVQVDSKASIGGGSNQLKARSEKINWELRRTEFGWEAITPSDRTYVSHDVAVRNLAAQLARIAESEGAAAHLEAVLRQESELASLLGALLGSN